LDQDTLRILLREAVRETVSEVLQILLEADRAAFLREHGGQKNGHYPRKLETAFGQVHLKVPRDREGRYYPAFLHPYARRLVDVGEVAVALYAAGVSQRRAAEVMSLLLGHRYSHETLSALTDEILGAAEAFRKRPLPAEMAFVYLDGLSLKVFREGEGIVRETVYVALGLAPDGERRVLGFWLLPTENATAWEEVLRELWQRGLRRVLLFITDGLPGMEEAIRRVYPLAQWQVCVVHRVRSSLAQVRSRDRALLAQDLKGIYGARSRVEALEALERLKEAWGARYPSLVAAWWENSGALLRFYDYPQVLWPYLRSTNLMERFIREVRRGTKVRDHKFPGEEAVYKLLYLESERQEGRWAERRLKGFAEVQEVLEGMLRERYAPRTQTLTHNRALPKTPSSPSLSLLQEFLGDFIVEQANQAPQEQVRTIPLAGQPQLPPSCKRNPLNGSPNRSTSQRNTASPSKTATTFRIRASPRTWKVSSPSPVFKSRKNRSTSHRLRYASTTCAASSLPLTGKLVSSHHSPRRPRAGTRQTTRWSRLPSTSTSLHPKWSRTRWYLPPTLSSTSSPQGRARVIQPPELRHFYPASRVMSCMLCPSASSITSFGVR
jgi:putative transposase